MGYGGSCCVGVNDIKGVVMKEKLFSGRFWLTVITGLVFAYATCTKILDSQAVSAIVTMVFIAYFQRTDRGKNGNA